MDLEHLAWAMESKGWNQATFAREMGTTQQNVSLYFRGKRDPKSAFVSKAATLLGVSGSFLLGLTDDPYEGVDTPKGSDSCHAAPELSEDERALLGLFRSCSPEGRKAILATIRELARAGQEEARRDPERGAA